MFTLGKTYGVKSFQSKCFNFILIQSKPYVVLEPHKMITIIVKRTNHKQYVSIIIVYDMYINLENFHL